jgi:IS30 family transposase
MERCMKKRKRTWLTPSERARLWELWRLGTPLALVGRALAIQTHTVAACLERAGGFAPRTQRRTSALTEPEREEISRGIASGCSIRSLAQLLGRAPSTISREIRRNYGRDRYRASSAERRAWKCARRPKSCKLLVSKRLRRVVAAKLRRDWSPQQIAEWLRRNFANDSTMNISHETIYRSLFLQARGVLKAELRRHLRTGRARRRPHRESTNDSASIVDGISISERPPEVDDRAVPGHWEGDLLFGTVNSYIATLVERTTRYCVLVKVTAKETKIVTGAIRKQITRLPEHVCKSLTWDRGSEMAGHKAFTVATDIPVYFCDPRSPWQRGSNENTNGLLRQYFPNGEDVSHYSQAELDRVAYRLNGRPRKTLDYKTPAEVFSQLLP